MTEPATQTWWELAKQAVECCDWPTAEGALKRLDSLAPGQAQVLDLLGYVLLMQGQFVACEGILRQALAMGRSSFWTPHKLGDALRGQQRMDEAVAAYEMALLWGSDSPLTTRNLLQVLDGLDPGRAVSKLEEWASAGQPDRLADRQWLWSERPPWLLGACEAAISSGGPELAAWLQAQGCPDPAIRRLAMEAAIVQLDLDQALQLAQGIQAQRLRFLLGSGADLQLA